jgi:hypothetical protein
MLKEMKKNLGGYDHHLSLHSHKKREHSSVGLEHLPYKQRVRGSNPCAPTVRKGFQETEALFCYGKCSADVALPITGQKSQPNSGIAH